MERKTVLFLASEKGYRVLLGLCTNGFQNEIACVISFKELNVEKSWHEDIKSVCDKNNIQFYMWVDIKDSLKDLLKKYNATNCIAISWRYMLPTELNKLLMDPIIVLHDSLLPKYRGFSPTPTAIMLGETNFGVTALFATDEVDEGDIIQQEKVFIDDSKYVMDIIGILSELYIKIVLNIFKELKKGTLNSIPQDESEASYSIWRDIEDCHIDWSQRSRDIYNFIRAVGKPYYGAYSFLDEEKIIIEKSEICEKDLNFVKRDYGKIWRIEDGCPIVICGKGMLKITKARYKDKKEESVIFKKIRCRFK